jgi:hypothetical protein
MRIKLWILACLCASAQFLGATAIASCSYGYPVRVEQQAAYGDTAAQVNCQSASASVSFSLVRAGPEDPEYIDVVLLSILGDTHADSGAGASLRLPLVVVGGPPQGRLLINGLFSVELFSHASSGHGSMQVGDWWFSGAQSLPALIDYTRDQPFDLSIEAGAGACVSCAGGAGGYRATVEISIDLLNAGDDYLAKMAHLEVAPEPGCLWLGAAGLCALGVVRRHRDPAAGARNSV